MTLSPKNLVQEIDKHKLDISKLRSDLNNLDKEIAARLNEERSK